jgi:asparagine synthase (glutamine-hydrolysing)
LAGICGWLDDTANSSPADLSSMAAALARFDGAHIQTAQKPWYGLAAADIGSNQFLAEEGDLLVAYSGAPSFANRDLNELSRARGRTAALAEGFRRWQHEIATHLLGQYCIAIVDQKAKTLCLAVDRFATHPLAYAAKGNSIRFASNLDSLNIDQSLELSPQSIFNYVYFHVIPGPETIYRDVRRLSAGESLTFENGEATIKRYWRAEFIENQHSSFDELKQDFLGALRTAVKTSSEGQNCGAFLSGGTDSSTIAGLLGEVSGAPARTYSIGFEAAGYDEMEYARIAAKQFKTDHHEYYVTPTDVAEAIPKIAQVYDQPFGNSSAVPTYFCARFAQQDGVELLLGGDGGDELYGGNERYAKQHIFEHYQRIPNVIRSALIGPMIGLPGIDSIAPLRKAKSYVNQARLPMPARMETYNLLDRFGVSNVLSADFLAGVNAHFPLQHLTEVYDDARANTLINRMLALDFKLTLTDNDLPKVSRMCELAKVNVAYPMLDDGVLDFSLRLAPGLKLKGTKLRYFFKEALRGFLPDAIITKSKHGFGLPFGPWLRDHAPLQKIAYGSLEQLGDRGIIRKEFTRELIDVVRSGHAGYYGTMVWVLMMLELWLAHHQSARHVKS